MDKTTISLLTVIFLLLLSVFVVSAVPKPAEIVSAAPVTAAGAQQPVTITPSSPMTVMVLGNGAQTSVEVI